MAFTDNWDVFGGEVPTATKWNQLGENDDYLFEQSDGIVEKVAVPLFLVFRTTPVTWDYNSNADHSWTTYNAAGIIPDGAVKALIRAYTTGGSNNKLEFRKDSSVTGTYSLNPAMASPAGDSNSEGKNGSTDLIIDITTARTFQHSSPYGGGGANSSARRFAIMGWYAPFDSLA
jgi:hypothetical protein